jgi:hypothetical protein
LYNRFARDDGGHHWSHSLAKLGQTTNTPPKAKQLLKQPPSEEQLEERLRRYESEVEEQAAKFEAFKKEVVSKLDNLERLMERLLALPSQNSPVTNHV